MTALMTKFVTNRRKTTVDTYPQGFFDAFVANFDPTRRAAKLNLLFL